MEQYRSRKNNAGLRKPEAENDSLFANIYAAKNGGMLKMQKNHRQPKRTDKKNWGLVTA
jgi:hypothetical protein